jgi:hypothetical protein
MYCELLVLGLALRQPHVVVSHEPLPQPSTPTAQKMYELDIRMFKAGGMGWWWGVGGGSPALFRFLRAEAARWAARPSALWERPNKWA